MSLPSSLGRRQPVAILAGLLGCVGPTRTPPQVAWTPRGPGLEAAQVSLGESGLSVAVRFDQSRYRLRLLAPAGGLRVPEAAPADAVAIINGGYFEPDLRPSGLVVDQGREVSAPSSGSGLLLLGERLQLTRFRATSTAGLQGSALQVWPFLIEPGGAPGIRRDDQKRARRSAIGLDDAGRGVLVAVDGPGVSLFELMGLCRSFGAVVAANLDGGPSTGFALLQAAGLRIPSATAVATALVLVAR